MKKTIDKKIIIDPKRKGIVYEDYLEFDKSIFEKVYEKAKKLTQGIIQDNERLNVSKAHGNDYRNREQMDNVITFVGRRGTGKTSAMLSFMEALKDNNEKHHVLEWDERGQYKFVGLDWIDASMLEENEGIFDTILVKMFGEFLKYNKDVYGRGNGLVEADNKEVYQQFESVHKKFLNLKHQDEQREYNRGNTIAVLRDLAGSNRIREEFAKLVTSYISFIETMNNKESFYKGKTYLVIAIDDIDLNVQNGYKILEEIHRYLMVPGVIVLLAINYEEMLLCCEREYVKNYEGMPNECVGNLGKRARTKSEQYLEKVLPPYMRVYLPSLKKRDYTICDDSIMKVEETEVSGIKQGMFWLIAEKTGVFYDAKGVKRHFMEPITLRNLGSNYKFYDEMEKLPNRNGNDFLIIYDKNYHKVMDDLLFRFACESLPSKEYQLFIKWSEEDILRRGKEIISSTINEYPIRDKENRGYKGEYGIDEFALDYEKFKYSYGELLRCLFCISRKGIYDKKLVHVLLAQYTLALSWIYEHYLYEVNTNSKIQKYRKLMGELLRDSIGGSFSKYIGPMVGKMDFGMAKILNMKDVRKLLFKYNDKEKIESIREKKSVEECVEYIKGKDFDGLMLSIFFLNNFGGRPGFNGRYKISIYGLQGTDGCGFYIDGSMEFNMFNFVNNSFFYEETIRDAYIALVEAVFEDESGGSMLSRNEIIACVDKMVKSEIKRKDSILHKFSLWSKNGERVVLPVYNLDVMYNLFKRLVVNPQHGMSSKIEQQEAYDVLKQIFYEIRNRLNEQDEFYNESNRKSNFRERFEKCPIVESILNDSQNRYKEHFVCFYEGEFEEARQKDDRIIEEALKTTE